MIKSGYLACQSHETVIVPLLGTSQMSTCIEIFDHSFSAMLQHGNWFSIQFLPNSHALPSLFPPTPFLGFDQLLHFTPEANILAATCVREHTVIVPLCLAYFLKRNVFQFKDCLDTHVYLCPWKTDVGWGGNQILCR